MGNSNFSTADYIMKVFTRGFEQRQNAKSWSPTKWHYYPFQNRMQSFASWITLEPW
jgi:hypothetical protein